MIAAIADVVHPIFQAGLALQARLDAGEILHRDPEQEAFIQMLAALDTLLFSEGDSSDLLPIHHAEPSGAERDRLTQATVRYMLVCWLDETNGQNPQGESWREQPLESLLFAHTNGSAKFWDEARYAEARGDRDALEIAYWCVTLGFRGDWRDKRDMVDAWITRVRAVLVQPTEPTAMPASLDPPVNGRQRMVAKSRRPWAMAFYMALTILAPVIGLLVWRYASPT